MEIAWNPKLTIPDGRSRKVVVLGVVGYLLLDRIENLPVAAQMRLLVALTAADIDAVYSAFELRHR